MAGASPDASCAGLLISSTLRAGTQATQARWPPGHFRQSELAGCDLRRRFNLRSHPLAAGAPLSVLDVAVKALPFTDQMNRAAARTLMFPGIGHSGYNQSGWLLILPAMGRQSSASPSIGYGLNRALSAAAHALNQFRYAPAGHDVDSRRATDEHQIGGRCRWIDRNAAKA